MPADPSPASLEGRVALVTGSGGMMGRAEAVLFGRRGAAVVVHDVRKEAAEETAELVRATGARAAVVVADVRDRPALTDGIAQAAAVLGDVDVLVNNAGVGGEYLRIEEIDDERLARMLDIHVRGAFVATQAVLPAMRARGRGAIVNISSAWGQAGNPDASHYCGAKAALLGLTKAWARELAADGIRVNAVAPGWVGTGMGTPEVWAKAVGAIPLGRFGDPAEVAETVVFLASDAAAFITGQCVGVNGGELIA